MNNLNIPLYRAEKIESNKYVEGFLIKKNYDNQKVRYFILEDKKTEVAMTYEIDPTTLAINFNDMLDSQGNKIFASLSKNGKGGDIYTEEDNEGYTTEDENEINTFVFSSEGTIPYYESYNTKKVIGIQK